MAAGILAAMITALIFAVGFIFGAITVLGILAIGLIEIRSQGKIIAPKR
jgi:hypothetical protein